MLIVQTTCKSRAEAEKIGVALVRERLAACASVHPCKSIFFWQGRLERQSEWVLELKITNSKYARTERRIRQLHSYALPQIIAFSVVRASKEYEHFIRKGR